MSEYSMREACLKCIRVELQRLDEEDNVNDARAWFEAMKRATNNIEKIEIKELEK